MRPYYRFCRFWCQWFCLLFFRVRVFGRRSVPDRGGVLLVCNHQSFFDPVLVTMALHREANYMARDTLFRNAWFRLLIKSLNAFPIRRGAADVQAVKETMRRLKAGKVVVTFPEGTRTRDGSVGPFLPGPAAVAIKVRAAIVPVYIEGAYLSWPRHRTLPGPAPVTIRYGRPMHPDELAAYTPQALAQALHERVVALGRAGARPGRSRAREPAGA